MTREFSDTSSTGEAVDALVGMRVWKPAIGVGSFITMNFGAEVVDSKGRTHGELYLWIYGAAWTARRRGRTLATSAMVRERMVQAIGAFDGEEVTRVALGLPDLSLSIEFGHDLRLVASPSNEPDMEHWLLFLPDGSVVAAGPGTKLTRESAGG